MREMHKWKDKVELSLDNRQIFFLFFGVSIVGCFVFALGIMVGRRVQFDTAKPVVGLTGDSLSLLDVETVDDASLTFQEGLRSPATESLPKTRSLDEDSDTKSADVPSESASPTGAASSTPPAPGTPGSTAVSPVPAKASAPAKAPEPTLAAAAPKHASDDDRPASSSPGRRFTLQLKAFSQPEDAEALAAQMRDKGHAARVEASEVRGRIWHRVRVGQFGTWNEGLAAKEAFEKQEQLIAYVVRQ